MITQHIVAEANELSASTRWQNPDSPGSAHILELAQRLAQPSLYADFRRTPDGAYLLEILEAYESAFNDDWLPEEVVGLSLARAREFIQAIADELVLSTSSDAIMKLRMRYSKLSAENCDHSDCT
jgi:hypothetical protein